MSYVRWESPVPDADGLHVGIFGLTNTLARSGRLTRVDWAWWRRNNDWLDAAYVDPSTVDATLFEQGRAVSCWFRDSATHLLDRVPGYLDLLDRYDVAWVERRSSSPGRVVYEDGVQIVVAHDSNRVRALRP